MGPFSYMENHQWKPYFIAVVWVFFAVPSQMFLINYILITKWVPQWIILNQNKILYQQICLYVQLPLWTGSKGLSWISWLVSASHQCGIIYSTWHHAFVITSDTCGFEELISLLSVGLSQILLAHRVSLSERINSMLGVFFPLVYDHGWSWSWLTRPTLEGGIIKFIIMKPMHLNADHCSQRKVTKSSVSVSWKNLHTQCCNKMATVHVVIMVLLGYGAVSEQWMACGQQPRPWPK